MDNNNAGIENFDEECYLDFNKFWAVAYSYTVMHPFKLN